MQWETSELAWAFPQPTPKLSDFHAGDAPTSRKLWNTLTCTRPSVLRLPKYGDGSSSPLSPQPGSPLGM